MGLCLIFTPKIFYWVLSIMNRIPLDITSKESSIFKTHIARQLQLFGSSPEFFAKLRCEGDFANILSLSSFQKHSGGRTTSSYNSEHGVEMHLASWSSVFAFYDLVDKEAGQCSTIG